MNYQSLRYLPPQVAPPQVGNGPTKPENDKATVRAEEWASWLAKAQAVVPDSKVIENLSSLMPEAPISTQFIAGSEVVGCFLRQRKSFQMSGKPIVVKVGFHYTPANNVKQIQRCGLRPSSSIKYYGSGVYLSENPHAFSPFGDMGILVLYISGTELVLSSEQKSGDYPGVDSFRGNKVSTKKSKLFPEEKGIIRMAAKTTYYDEIIMRKKDQVLPLFAFPRDAVNNAEHLFQFHKRVQELVDRTINYPEDYGAHLDSKSMVPRKTVVRRIYPSLEDMPYEHLMYKECEKHRRFRKPTPLRFLKDGRVVRS